MRFEDFMAELEAEAREEGPEAIAELEAFRRAFAEERQRLEPSLSSLVERLARVIQPASVPAWLEKPNPLLDDDTPADRIAAGDARSVARLISGLEDPGAS